MAKYPNNKNGDPAEFEDVYAGPGMFDEPEDDSPKEPESTDEPMPEPDMPKDQIKKDIPKEPEFTCVYAGPDFFGVKEEEPDPDTEPEPDPDTEPEPDEDNKEEPDKKEIPPDAFKVIFDDRAYNPNDPRNNINQFMAVYAGPQFMMAYAGPQPNNGGGFIGMMDVMNNQPAAEKKKKCEKCGAEMPVSAKFCGNCGAKFPEKKFCPGCGAPIIEGSKFCCECGALLK